MATGMIRYHLFEVEVEFHRFAANCGLLLLLQILLRALKITGHALEICPTTSKPSYCCSNEMYFGGKPDYIVFSTSKGMIQAKVHVEDKVKVLHVPSRFQYADIFTKGLPSALFEEFRSSLSVQPPPALTAGAY
ncbi:hypothetical protein Tco_0179580 [Tanacetum coccineum]